METNKIIPKGFLYKCKCGFEKRMLSRNRGITCPNCGGMMKPAFQEGFK